MREETQEGICTFTTNILTLFSCVSVDTHETKKKCKGIRDINIARTYYLWNVTQRLLRLKTKQNKAGVNASSNWSAIIFNPS